jgi:hypothetical protein
MTFVHLCKLSQILGDILPYVYALHLNVDDLSRSLRRVECALDDWLENLQPSLQFSPSNRSTVDGSSNLWFMYLSIKVFVCRLAYKVSLWLCNQ